MTGGHARLLQDRHQRQHGEGRVGGGLEHDRAAGGERRADLARRHGGGEIPRRYQHRDAGRLVMNEDAGAGSRGARNLADVAHRFFRVPAEELGGIGDLAAGIGQCLAVLDGDQLGEPLGVAHDQLIGLAQDLGALARLSPGPARKGIARRIDRGLGVLHRGARNRSDFVLGRRIEHIEAATVG